MGFLVPCSLRPAPIHAIPWVPHPSVSSNLDASQGQGSVAAYSCPVLLALLSGSRQVQTVVPTVQDSCLP